MDKVNKVMVSGVVKNFFWFFCILMLVVTVGSQIVITGSFKEKEKVLAKMKEEAESKAKAKAET